MTAKARTLALAAGWALAAGGAAALTPVSCLIQPEDTVRLATPVAGIVAEVPVERGDIVTAGTVVARLDSTLEDIALALAEARAANPSRIHSLEARVAFLEAQLDRNERLATRDAVPEATVQESRLERAVARLELDEAHLARTLAGIEADQSRALLAQKTLRAPIAGVVTERLISPGEFRDPQQGHLVTIARLDVLRVEAFAPIAHYAELEVGREVTIRPEAPFGGAWPATITIIDRVFDAATATFGLVMRLENADLLLPAGLRCEVDFTAPDGG
ncbi:efflux RND transporter periplasmic adaptor subunit [Rhodobaculum claviforme]|uniref:efflux RND transporter periplasmic adaptor subunit n=1 Tax=Rhodobaculum claviforme TaxID=1549854 RepID=UPI0019130985|nr:efflux RND transporter periplasmic adaptor subunit [Rhodobaculum claviforme]